MMILLGLRSVLQQGNPIVFCGESELEIQAFEAYCDQEEIGWKHFLLGNISHKWKEAMADHYANLESTSDNKLSRHLSAKVWTKKLLCHVIHISLNRWQLRNKFHQAMISDHYYCEERESLLDKIEIIFAKQHPVTPAFNTLFSHTYHSLASLLNMGIRNWLKSYGMVCKFVGPSLMTFHFSQ